MWDRRITFLGIFIFTLGSTVLVGFVSWYTGQRLLTTVLYSLATMWITGIVGQIVLQALYLNIVRPIENQNLEKTFEEDHLKLDLENIESIEEVEAAATELARRREDKQSGRKPGAKPPEPAQTERTS